MSFAIGERRDVAAVGEVPQVARSVARCRSDEEVEAAQIAEAIASIRRREAAARLRTRLPAGLSWAELMHGYALCAGGAS